MTVVGLMCNTRAVSRMPLAFMPISTIALIGFRGLMLQHGPRSAPPYLRPLKKKGFKEDRVTTIGLYDIGTSTTLESNKSLPLGCVPGQSTTGVGAPPHNADRHVVSGR